MFLFKLNVSRDTGCKYLEIFLVFWEEPETRNSFLFDVEGGGEFETATRRGGRLWFRAGVFAGERLRRIDKGGMLFWGEKDGGSLIYMIYNYMILSVNCWLRNWRKYYWVLVQFLISKYWILLSWFEEMEELKF